MQHQRKMKGMIVRTPKVAFHTITLSWFRYSPFRHDIRTKYIFESNLRSIERAIIK